MSKLVKGKVLNNDRLAVNYTHFDAKALNADFLSSKASCR